MVDVSCQQFIPTVFCSLLIFQQCVRLTGCRHKQILNGRLDILNVCPSFSFFLFFFGLFASRFSRIMKENVVCCCMGQRQNLVSPSSSLLGYNERKHMITQSEFCSIVLLQTLIDLIAVIYRLDLIFFFNLQWGLNQATENAGYHKI